MLRVGTRGSKLALIQTHAVIKKIKEFDKNISCEIVPIKTTGDIITDRPLVDIGGKALFLKEIEENLLLNKIDIAVHSLKDVPAFLPDGLIIPSVTERLSSEDVFISHHLLFDLPFGSTIGTCSSRRKAFLINLLGNAINVVGIRGNINTRIEKFKRGEVDGIVLAKAGVERLGISMAQVIPKNLVLPAIGQGSIAIECREDDSKVIEILNAINHIHTCVCITAERGFMIGINGNCKTPIAALAELKNGILNLEAAFAIPNGEKIFSISLSEKYIDLQSAHKLGMKAAQHIKKKIIESKYMEVVKDLFV